MNDQTVKADAGKLPLTLVPSEAIEDIAEVRRYGNNKYPKGGKDNWKQVEVQRYRDALFRHLLAYLRDPHGVDKESGIKHYKHLICNAAFICALEREAEAKERKDAVMEMCKEIQNVRLEITVPQMPSIRPLPTKKSPRHKSLWEVIKETI